MNEPFNKLFDDNGNVLVTPINCVLKMHQEKANEKRKSFEKMAFWAFCQATDNIPTEKDIPTGKDSNFFLQVLCDQNRKVANIFS